MAGSRQGTDLTPLAELAKGYLMHKKAELDWPSDQRPDDLPEGAGKLILNMIALGIEALPRGGTIGVSATAGSGGNIEVKAVGSDAALREDAASSLEDSVQIDDLTPRNVHGYLCSASWTVPTSCGDGVSVASPSSVHLAGQPSSVFRDRYRFALNFRISSSMLRPILK